MSSASFKQLTPKRITKLLKRWQRCRSSDLPDLFYAYDEAGAFSERVVTYFLDGKGLAELDAIIGDTSGQKRYLYVHCGLRKGYRKGYAPTRPYFFPILELRVKGVEALSYCWELTWDPDPRFPKYPNNNVDSGLDAIPAPSAFLFVHSWLECPHNALNAPFESTAYHLCRRVQAYRFQEEESAIMLGRVSEAGDGRLDIHLGRGVSVYTHPFSFRPIVQVRDEDTLSLADGGIHEGSFYDFSVPIPPPPSDGQ